MAKATAILLSDEERRTLLKWANSGTIQSRHTERARIILAIAEGKTNKETANKLNTRSARVSKWRTRFAQDRLEGLKDAPRKGAPQRYDSNTEHRILHVLDDSPPKGFATWTGKLVAEQLGDVSKHKVWRVLRQHGIYLQRRRSWCISTDPEFAAKAADIVGLYLDPPENAIVLCVDEKPSIQALERAQGWLKMPDGTALTGYSHRYKRHGTTTLFAALEVATGLVQGGHFKRRRRREFLTFMNNVVKEHTDEAHLDRQIHVILDNLNTHKPKRDRWLARHKNVHFHYTPTNASWLNQVEIWFSILSRRSLKGASFTSPQQVRKAIDDFICVHNKDAAPFQWKKTKVYRKNIENRYSYLCN